MMHAFKNKLNARNFKHLLYLCFLACYNLAFSQTSNQIPLSGNWGFKIDRQDVGVQQKWFFNKLDGHIQLPGSMTSNNLGDEVSVSTQWTGQILDSAYFKSPDYAKYRVPGNIKVPFFLQPIKYYKGAAWYQKTIIVSKQTKNLNAILFIERSHWETTLWLDGKPLGMQDGLATPHSFELGKLTQGKHVITIRVDNRIKEFNVGPNSHSISDHTQGNWNGMIGKMYVDFKPNVAIDLIKIYADVANKQIKTQLTINNYNKTAVSKNVNITVNGIGFKTNLKSSSKTTLLKPGKNSIELVYNMGADPLLWDEFRPNLYKLSATLNAEPSTKKTEVFGMRNFSSEGTQFTINGRKIFLRGTLECAIFPLTGFPPTSEAEWEKIFKKCKEYGLNHIRFHSWCPPKAAFNVADRMGFYLQVECSSWANLTRSVGIGQGLGIDQYIYDESNRIVDSYGNHPSFVMMAYGNEPSGVGYEAYLKKFVAYWKARDSRRLYTTGAGWPVISTSDFNSSPEPRIQLWGAGLKSIINSKPPSSDYDWRNVIAKWQHPTVSHEIGQWCVYPDFKEIKKYTGVFRAKNFEIFQDRLNDHKLGKLADSFLLASGKLQVLCYKADIEAALRTPDFGGFQLLDLHDFPGQGSAIVGVLNAFWEEKGYVTGAAYSRFCNSTVPLVRLKKMIFLNNENLTVPVEVAHFGEKEIINCTPKWSLQDMDGKIIFEGKLKAQNIPIGNAIQLGEINQPLSNIKKAGQFKLSISINNFTNDWDLFIYPSELPKTDDKIKIVNNLDEKTIAFLNSGGNVLINVKKGNIKPNFGGDVKIGFSSIFWNTLWTNKQPPHTLGVLVNPKHKAFANFPTNYYSDWQWWDAMSHSSAILLDSVNPQLKPIIRVIDDWFTARNLGLIFECKIGKGKVIFSAVDFTTDLDSRAEAKQLKNSLLLYMGSNNFNPQIEVSTDKIIQLLIDNK